ncbi:hypothetical protein Micbo1qcDRAFT_44891 [Microdochium bolleyi]|uniref:Serine-rich protein n=1 Tax=Microdochium bolleyi TaxID=196109 RepID=A0A136JBP7_9PEZI|nr:hypothetical protein Micbo1qcDRAFT_44891 [Microdochium bolleyi]
MASSTTASQQDKSRGSSSSEASRGGIRIVPYSPPKPIEEHDEHARHAATTPTRPRFVGASDSQGPYQSSPESAASSAASSTNSLADPRTGRVSARRRLGSVSDAESTSSLLAPAPRRASHSCSRSPSVSPSPSYSHSTYDHPLSPSSSAPGRSRRSNVLEINPDKTFSVVLRPTRQSNATATTSSSITSAPLTAASLVSSHEQASLDAPHHDIPPSSPLSSVPESESPQVSPRTSIAEPSAREPDLSSPWNYRMTGGVRKVPQTPEPRSRGSERSADQSDVESPSARAAAGNDQYLAEKASFSSQGTDSSLYDNSNLQIIGQSSPVNPYYDSAVASPAPSGTNVQILGVSSPVYPSSPSRATDVLETPGSRNFVVHNAATPGSALFTPARGPSSVLETPGSKNFVVHGKGTPASQLYTPYTESAALETPGSRNFVTHGPVSRQSSVGTFPRHQPSVDSIAGFVREQYSQESLKVSPLNTRRKSSQDRLDYSRQIPREAIRPRAASYSSINSVISQDLTSLALQDQEPGSGITWTGPFGTIQYPKRMEAQPHQWSSQLSTVMSEDERSEGSRIASQFSERSGSQHSRNMLSSSMSLSADEARSLGTQSRMDLERPSPTYLPSPVIRMIRDHDEDGDGLADLEEPQHLRHKASWTRGGSYLSRRSSDRDLHSSASSRTNSISGGNIPYWARVYYGSGERKWLAAPSLRSQPSMQSISGAPDSRRGSFAASGSPEHDGLQEDIYNPRRRARDMFRRGSRSDSLQITQAPLPDVGPYRPRKKTSSIWSPHLRVDRRATLYNAWSPPSVAWSAESSMLGRRNAQIILFVLGFIFPFAWMIGAFLPLPVPKHFGETGLDNSQTELGAPVHEKFQSDQHFAYDDASYQSARWWRNLNRVMSIIGILVLGAVAALVVIGIKDRWVR